MVSDKCRCRVNATMEFDLHIHTNRYSGCSNIDPLAVIEKACAVGLNGIALTEHGIRWPDHEIEKLVNKSGIRDLIIIPGQEVACYSQSGKFQGEFLVFGYPESLGSNKSIQQVIDMVHTEGGVVIAAHPFKKLSHGEGFYGSGHSTNELDIDGLEIEHPSYDEESRDLAKTMMKTMKIAGLGNSDSHDLNSIGLCRSYFKEKISGVDKLCEEIRARRVQAMNFK